MAFLDNSGDIILDAVLTDTGRMRLAKGDGTFKIAKFALGDDEINYSNYNNLHPSGSAYYDLNILQTPILEAFTNNTSLMKSKLISISRTNLLYLPVMLLNRTSDIGSRLNTTTGLGAASGPFRGTHYVVTVDERTSRPCTSATQPAASTPGLMPTTTATDLTQDGDGIMNGFSPASSTVPTHVRVDQGLNTDEIHPQHRLSSDLQETQYIIEMDNRLGTIVSAGTNGQAGGAKGTPAAVSFIDDDNIASYFLSLGTDLAFVFNITDTALSSTPVQNSELNGPRGTGLTFQVAASTELQTSDFLFQRLGIIGATDNWSLPSNATIGGTVVSDTHATVNYIDSTIRITGATTGTKIDIPIRYVKRVGT